VSAYDTVFPPRKPLKVLLFAVATVTALLVIQGVLPNLSNAYVVQVVILTGIDIVLAVSLNLINGFTGQFSLGHAGFMAVGGYLSAAITFYLGEAWIISMAGIGIPAGVASTLILLTALFAGGLVAAAVGFLVGLPTLRLRGDYLAIVTLGFGEIIRVVILNTESVGGARGFSGIPPYANMFWVCLLAVLTVIIVRNLISSSHGRAFLSVREDEVAAEAMGINVTRYKVIAFIIGSFFAGVAGALFAHTQLYLHTNTFTFLKSFEVVVMVVLGGMGSITGSVFAAVAINVLKEGFREFQEYRMVIYSVSLIILMIARPQGIFGTHEINKAMFARLFRRKAEARP
jgi:branched-chain amino acid transport system permease protein